MSSKSPTSADCIFRNGTRCRHPAILGETSDAKCSECRRYAGSSRGLGDTIHSALEATGVAKVVDSVASALGADCGCHERRIALNERFPFTDSKNEV